MPDDPAEVRTVLSVGDNSAGSQVDRLTGGRGVIGAHGCAAPDRPEVRDGPGVSRRAVNGVVIMCCRLIGDVAGRRYRCRIIRRWITEHATIGVGSGDNDACRRIPP